MSSIQKVIDFVVGRVTTLLNLFSKEGIYKEPGLPEIFYSSLKRRNK